MMGCPLDIICETCKTVYYCGYGSYLNISGRIQLFPAQEHEGHKIHQHTHEATEISDSGHLVIEDYFGEPEEKRIFVRDYASFKQVDLTDGK
jgi:hypothetical protein